MDESLVLEAIASGKPLQLGTPDGGSIELHHEKLDPVVRGDWGWVARNRRGESAVFTFASDAVYADVPYGDNRRRLTITTEDGITTAAIVDARSLPSGFGPLGNESDVTIPVLHRPDAAIARAKPKSTKRMPGDDAIDVGVWYSNGLRARHWSDSGAISRIKQLVRVTNQAFIDSNSSTRIRLVYAGQFGFDETSDNETMLGIFAGSTHVQALRRAHGADVALLVRPFRSASHSTCGRAYLNGYNRTIIRRELAYGVVSDGSDIDGLLNPCPDTVMAHELGHAIGLQHDVETATVGGVLQYGSGSTSFGHRNASVQYPFHTIMAYNAGGMYPTKSFSSAAQAHCGGNYGVPCGNGSQDNVRAMSYEDLFYYATRFHERRPAPQSDFDGDWGSDILWYNSASGAVTIWRRASPCLPMFLPTVRDLRWKPAFTADFDGDGVADLFWRHSASGANVYWAQGSPNASVSLATVPGTAWIPATAADFDGDGKADILWRNVITGANAIWRSGHIETSMTMPSMSVDWQLAGAGNLGSGHSALMWRNARTGQNLMWTRPLESPGAATPMVTVASQDWQVAAIADFNGDGTDEVFWRNRASGANSIWTHWYSDTRPLQTTLPLTTVPVQWSLALAGDVRKDGRADLLWRNRTTGANSVWNLSPTGVPDLECAPGVVPLAWQVIR